MIERRGELITIAALLIAFALVGAGCDRGTSSPSSPSTGAQSMQPFEAGQIWTYHTRAGEEASRVTICKVEADPKLGSIVHIHVTGVRIKMPHGPKGFSDVIGHMPYAADALGKSVVKLESSGNRLPAFEDGYQEWKSAHGGVWTLPLKEAIEAMERAMNKS